MKSFGYAISIVLVLGLFIFSCEQEAEKSKQLTLTGELLNHSACKSGLKSTNASIVTPDSISCVEYSFDEVSNKLTIKHVNAGFNCCTDSIYCKISEVSDTIFVQEFEKNPSCHCNCLFDLNIELSGVDTKKYTLKFIEPYAGNQDKLFFEIDLAKDKAGSFCVTRKQYPWEIGLN